MSQKLQQVDARRRRFFWITGGIIAALLVIFLLQNTGTTNTLSIGATGEPASVFIDRTRSQPLQLNSSSTTYNVSAGTHQVIVAYDGYWPWSDEVTVSSGATTSIAPFLIEQNSRRVLQTTSQILEALSAAEQEPTPHSESPVTSDTENIEVFVENTTNIVARWNGASATAPDFFSCNESECLATVYDQNPVQQISFYPGRDDVIFFATETAVYAIEINPTGSTQNFQPVVEGLSNPIFTISDGNIFVLANDRITVSDI